MAETLGPNSPYTFFSNATTGTGGPMFMNGQGRNISFACIGNGTGTITGGVITLEEAYIQNFTVNGVAGATDYTGPWSLIATVTGTALTTGAQSVSHASGSYWAVRARISTVISGGGTVTVVGWGS